MNHPDALDNHPSLSASLEDFEHNDRSPTFGLPSQHSGFKSEESEPEGDSTSEGPWSPPAWRRQTNDAGWYQHQPYAQESRLLRPSKSPSRSRTTSPRYQSAKEDEGDTILPANIPLPRGSMSPVKEQSPGPAEAVQSPGNTFHEPVPSDEPDVTAPSPSNYVRFALRAEVQQRTEPIEAALSWVQRIIANATQSKTSFSSAITVVLVAILALRFLTHTPQPPPVPDLVKVAGLARSFEPLIFYSENGVKQIGDLQETGVAVWDLGESVRFVNMTSAPIIVSELDSLSENLKNLASELSRFFTNVDGDIDGILIVMEWAQRELSALDTMPASSLSTAFTNIHVLLSHVGLLENQSTGLPTSLGKVFTSLFGTTHSQRTQQTLHRTFNEFLGILEESINSELTHSSALFALFESIDRQFLNIQRSVVRETDTQDQLQSEFLSSLWVRLMGPNASQMRKYEKNKALLASVRAKTTQNKSLLVDHNGKLIALKGNLESLRRKLVSPLVRRRDGSTVGVEDQIRGLEGTYEQLKRVREKQKERVMEVLYGVGRSRMSLGKDDRGVEIDGPA
ncbi:MAG: hypothetical protein LQ343_000326 [Gyalolechia ehrenbergii]|nr:MAG: hypothetical protein LQ343_000326 [Gyalolechia ehrenbergii]